MSFTERKRKGSSTYYYRTISYREDGKVGKKRIYLGRDLDEDELKEAEIRADRELEYQLCLEVVSRSSSGTFHSVPDRSHWRAGFRTHQALPNRIGLP